MKPKFIGGCAALAKDFNLKFSCCSSCHDEEWEGYGDLQEIIVDAGYYIVCCSAKEAYKKREEERFRERKNEMIQRMKGSYK